MRSGTGDWDFEIVHRDLKPSNSKTFHIHLSTFRRFPKHDSVFLGAENAMKGFPFYPVAKLGDFGFGVMTNHEDATNPSRLRGAGTDGYFAPVSAKVRVNTEKADLFRRNK